MSGYVSRSLPADLPFTGRPAAPVGSP